MNILSEFRRFTAAALEGIAPATPELLDMVRPAQDAKFGDYQANCAMPLGKQLGKSPRAIAEQLVAGLVKQPGFADLCETPEIAGPGFINLRVKTGKLAELAAAAAADPRLGVDTVAAPRSIVIDYSGPNVAKPMHVGHIRSTVIGDALKRVLSFQGHSVVGDNHVGDWGTQFGMILYGYKHFVDRKAYETAQVHELARLYKLVRKLVDYHAAVKSLPKQTADLTQREAEFTALAAAKPTDPKEAKKHDKTVRQKKESLADAQEDLAGLKKTIAAIEADAELKKLADAHPEIGATVLHETVKLHEGDAENCKLWAEFLPACYKEINTLYERLSIVFDEQLGESFYQDRLGGIVAEFEKKGLASNSNGATVVFLDGFETPMLIRKQDGAFLYATSDLATIQYRLDRWKPDAILYVVDHRQSLHFEQLFAAAKKCWGIDQVELKHIKFGTVLGQDGKPYKTRAGNAEGLDGLLDEAIERSAQALREADANRKKPVEFSEDERREIASRVGLGAVKYADLSQNRENDYVYDTDKMCAILGNTAAYMQYAYARTKAIFQENSQSTRERGASGIVMEMPEERALAVALLRFGETLDLVAADYRPNQLTAYLFDLTQSFSTFYEACPVVKAETDASFRTRLLLCELTAGVLAKGLELLGIKTVERM